MLPRRVYPVCVKHLYRSIRRTRQKPLFIEKHLPERLRSEAVDILFRRYPVHNLLFIQPLGKGELYENPVHLFVVIEIVDQLEQVLLCRCFRYFMGDAYYPEFRAGLFL